MDFHSGLHHSQTNDLKSYKHSPNDICNTALQKVSKSKGVLLERAVSSKRAVRI